MLQGSSSGMKWRPARRHRRKSQPIVSHLLDILRGCDSRIRRYSRVAPHIGCVLSQDDVARGKPGSIVDSWCDGGVVGSGGIGTSALRDSHGEVVDWRQKRKRKRSSYFPHSGVTRRDSYRLHTDMAAKGQDNELAPG